MPTTADLLEVELFHTLPTVTSGNNNEQRNISSGTIFMWENILLINTTNGPTKQIKTFKLCEKLTTVKRMKAQGKIKQGGLQWLTTNNNRPTK